jgi:hypothetical protein
MLTEAGGWKLENGNWKMEDGRLFFQLPACFYPNSYNKEADAVSPSLRFI